MSRVAEVVIAGAGIAGIAAAYELAVRRAVSRVVLLAPREPLSLTSRAGAEAYRNFWPGRDGTMVRFMNRSIDRLEALDLESGGAFELNRRGYVFLSADPREAARLREFDGPAAEFVEGDRAIHARFPYVARRTVAMLHVRRAGFMNTAALGRWLLERASAHGVEVVRDEAADLMVSDGRVTGVRLASGARINTPVFVLAAGPLLVEWTDRLQLRVPIVNELHGKIAFEDDAAVVPRAAPLLIWNDPVDLGDLGTFRPGVHLRPRGARSLLGIWTYDARIEHPTFPPAFAKEYAGIVLRGLTAMIPGLGRYVARAGEAIVDGGYYCKAPDNRPLIGQTLIEGAYVLGALSGFGIMASQAAAELLAAHLLHERLPDYAAAFHPARFEGPEYPRRMDAADLAAGQL